MLKDDIKKYKNTKRGNKIYPTLNKLFWDGIICFLCAIFIVVSTIILKDSIVFYFVAGLLIISGIYFIYTSHRLKIEEIVKMKKSINKKESKKKD